MKTLYFIAGCNGAGKTTASYTLLPELWNCREFINADEIAKGLSPFNPAGVEILSGRLMLARIEQLLAGEESFSIETTLSTKSYSTLIDKAHALGFSVKLLFFWLPSPETAIRRVEQRVSEGGHNIPIDIIKRRYKAGIVNLFNIYMNKTDEWMLVENLSTPRIVIASGGKDTETLINDVELFEKVKSYAR